MTLDEAFTLLRDAVDDLKTANALIRDRDATIERLATDNERLRNIVADQRDVIFRLKDIAKSFHNKSQGG